MESPYTQRESTSPVIAWVWQARPAESGSYLDLASEYWHVAFLTENGTTHAQLTGPATKPQPISYRAGQYYWGFVFKSHVGMPGVSKKQLLNAVINLPVDESDFIFGSKKMPMPTYDDVDSWADQAVASGLLVANENVAKALQGTRRMSERSLQRHVASATGLNRTQLRQIERAKQAFALLQQGTPIAEVATQTGYTDQAHLTKSLKLLAGQTPAQILSDYRG